MAGEASAGVAGRGVGVGGMRASLRTTDGNVPVHRSKRKTLAAAAALAVVARAEEMRPTQRLVSSRQLAFCCRCRSGLGRSSGRRSDCNRRRCCIRLGCASQTVETLLFGVHRRRRRNHSTIQAGVVVGTVVVGIVVGIVVVVAAAVVDSAVALTLSVFSIVS